MSTNFFNTRSGQYIALGGAAIVGVVFVVWYLKKQAKEAGEAVGGLLTGNNELTKGTPYEGAGVAGTLGAGANAISGGKLQDLGEWLGGKTFDLVSWFKGDPGPENLYYSVLFADGSKHAIGSQQIDSDGRFTYNGKQYRLGVNSSGKNYAVQL